VRDEWLADTSRNQFEQRYLRYVGDFLPRNVPQVIATGNGYFAMEYLGDGFTNWKTMLLAGVARIPDAEAAGHILGVIHARSHRDPVAIRDFDSTENFVQLRADPYVLTIGRRHPEIQDIAEREAARLCATRECLVHGDYSPKNVLLSDNRFVLVDCEVAWYGDPSFDLAFLLSHLLLKSAHHAPRDVGLARLTAAFQQAYTEARPMAPHDERELDERTAHLLEHLLLARIDGKSPAEYLEEPKRQFVRTFTLESLLAGRRRRVSALCDDWFKKLFTTFK
jgi:aminoglycoside phosphotransferase (APT) family kinase protein